MENFLHCACCGKDCLELIEGLCTWCGIHASHCCLKCSLCKYGGKKGHSIKGYSWEYCPVLEGDIEQEGPCEDCDFDDEKLPAEGTISQLTVLEIIEQVLLDVESLEDSDDEPEWFELVGKLSPLYSLKDWLIRELKNEN